MWHHGLALTAALCLSPLSPSETKSTPAAPAEQLLFNGKNLDGWRYYLSDHLVGMEDVWSVRDGLLVCKGEPMGYLYTKKPYTNFRLVVEWRWAPGKKPGNSGVLMRINGKPMPLPHCIEAQLQNGKAGDVYGFHGMAIDGDPARLRKVEGHELGGNLTGLSRISGQEKEPDQWNLYEIEMNGSNLKVRMNGTLVNEAKNVEMIAGPIGLQSEGGEVHFRKVALTPLPDESGK